MTDAEKLQRLLDLEDIRQLVARYNFAFDERDVAAYLECWVEDGFVERRNSKPSCRGHEQLAALVKDFPVDGRHVSTDLVIDLHGDEAEMRHYLLYLDMNGPCEVSMFGVWNDKVVRTPTGWKYKERIFDPLTIRESEVSEDFMTKVEAFER
ncbi:MAG TPA: nuclear transport factor 2 family protein [Allosphingosinicella sp.]|nr:nuclear transport factor 2 family protein [Allosphingosinicella sp.]